MKNVCVHSGFLLTMSIAVAVIGVAASLAAGEWHWFSRSGAVVVLIGVLMGARKCARIGLEGILQDAAVIGGPSFQATDPENTENERSRDVRAIQWGIWVAVVGTIIWGFGDLPDLFADIDSVI